MKAPRGNCADRIHCLLFVLNQAKYIKLITKEHVKHHHTEIAMVSRLKYSIMFHKSRSLVISDAYPISMLLNLSIQISSGGFSINPFGDPSTCHCCSSKRKSIIGGNVTGEDLQSFTRVAEWILLNFHFSRMRRMHHYPDKDAIHSLSHSSRFPK